MPVAQAVACVDLEALEIRVLHLQLVASFTTSLGTESVREAVVVRGRTAVTG